MKIIKRLMEWNTFDLCYYSIANIQLLVTMFAWRGDRGTEIEYLHRLILWLEIRILDMVYRVSVTSRKTMLRIFISGNHLNKSDLNIYCLLYLLSQRNLQLCPDVIICWGCVRDKEPCVEMNGIWES